MRTGRASPSSGVAAKKGKSPNPKSSTARQQGHLQRLQEAEGKRLVVDLDAQSRLALEELLAAGYANTQAAVVRLALLEARSKLSDR